MRKEECVPLSAVLREVLGDLGLMQAFVSAEVFLAWNAAVGDRVAESVLSKYFKDGKLYCTISSSALRSRLYYQKDSILDKINAVIGPEVVVKDIILK